MQVTIRPAEPNDVDSLVSLLAILFAIEADFAFEDGRQRRGLELMLASDHGCLLVADAEDRVVGMCSGQLTISTAEGGPAVLVEDVIVREEWRGRGVGRLLLAAVGEWAQARGASRLQLLADCGNEPALAFYHQIGWQPTRLICLRKNMRIRL